MDDASSFMEAYLGYSQLSWGCSGPSQWESDDEGQVRPKAYDVEEFIQCSQNQDAFMWKGILILHQTNWISWALKSNSAFSLELNKFHIQFVLLYIIDHVIMLNEVLNIIIYNSLLFI